MIESVEPKIRYYTPPKPKPDPKPKTAFERFMLERLEKLEARMRTVEGDTIDLMNHHGW